MQGDEFRVKRQKNSVIVAMITIRVSTLYVSKQQWLGTIWSWVQVNMWRTWYMCFPFKIEIHWLLMLHEQMAELWIKKVKPVPNTQSAERIPCAFMFQKLYFVTTILVRMVELVKSLAKVINADALLDLKETFAKVGTFYSALIWKVTRCESYHNQFNAHAPKELFWTQWRHYYLTGYITLAPIHDLSGVWISFHTFSHACDWLPNSRLVLLQVLHIQNIQLIFDMNLGGFHLVKWDNIIWRSSAPNPKILFLLK